MCYLKKAFLRYSHVLFNYVLNRNQIAEIHGDKISKKKSLQRIPLSRNVRNFCPYRLLSLTSIDQYFFGRFVNNYIPLLNNLCVDFGQQKNQFPRRTSSVYAILSSKSKNLQLRLTLMSCNDELALRKIRKCYFSNVAFSFPVVVTKIKLIKVA